MVYLSIGSNQGDRYRILQEAVNEINLLIGKVVHASPIYVSEPIGFISDELFLNACLQVYTTKSPEETLTLIHEIEKKHGRIRLHDGNYYSRPLDIDILYYDDLLFHNAHLTIPHPKLHERLFVLKPLNDLASNLVDPSSKLRLSELLANCLDTSILSLYEKSLLI